MRTTLPDEVAVLVETFTTFVRRELQPMERDVEWRYEDEIPQSVLRAVHRRSAELGFYAPDYPESVGGVGLSQLGMSALREQAFRLPGRLASHAVAGPSGPSGLLLNGSLEQQQRYLAPLVAGQATRALALTEAGAGSDAAAIVTRADQVSGGWRLNGSKYFITNAGYADIIIVVAKVADSSRTAAFIVEREDPGLRIGRRIHGMNDEQGQWEVVFDNCFLPDDRMIDGDAHYEALQNFAKGRLAIAATCVGMALRALDLGFEYADQRTTFGQPISSYQHVQRHLVDGWVETRCAQLLTYDTAIALDAGGAAMRESAAAKLKASEMAYQVIDSVLQVFGGAGWTRDLPLERLLRQVRMWRIVEGTSELLRVIIARTLLDGA